MADQANILIVDDLPENRLAYESVLEELGENLIAVRSGVEALEQVLKQDFAVILLDVNMPDMDGFETAQLIRQRRQSAHTPIIFLTAFVDEVRTARAYETGGVDYISTPVVPGVLRAKVRVFVELHRMRQQVAQQAEERAKRAAVEEAARRLVFLAEASRTLATSLDFEATLDRIGHLTVPYLADLSLVTLAEEPGHAGRSRCAWNHPPEGGVSQRSLGEVEPQAWLAEAIARVLSTGKPQLLARFDAPRLAITLVESRSMESTSMESPPGGLRPPLAESVPLVECAIVLPLAARGKTLGALTLAAGPSGRRFEVAEVALADELACRAGIALDNALLLRNIQENDRRKNEFLAMLGHELRNPLAPIRNAAELLGLCDVDHPEIKWAQEVIERQVTHLVRLVDDLLDVSRITRGKIQFLPETVDVASVVESAVETSRPAIEAQGHRLTVSMPEEPLRLQADSARLAQVLSNLLNNAAKYTPEGGRIELAVGTEEGHVVFRVRDTGAGIPAEMLAKIFDLFTQLDSSLDRSQGGLGIGLTLVRYIVEMHQGSVQAFSDGPGQGSEFVVRLPARCNQADQADADCERPPREAPHAARRVLVADDNVDAAESLAMLLRLNGHEAWIVHDGPAALEAAQSFRPDVVLLDIGLPGLDGYQVARRLRTQPATQEALLIAVSGYGQDEDRQRSNQAGFDHHLVKPVDFGFLQRVLSPWAVENERSRLSVVK